MTELTGLPTWTCTICGGVMSSTYKDVHWAKHMELGDQAPSPKAEGLRPVLEVTVFWIYCVLVGELGGIAFTSIYRAMH